mmetsp:Transcript_28431/g.23880  ORF Transcript_28431/g.23880 Transcript_28431/m.23880 type:complete len:108 (+) Transcript_28431:3-326(+)
MRQLAHPGYKGLLAAQHSSSLEVESVGARTAFAFAVRSGMRISFVPLGTLLIPPAEEGGEKGNMTSSSDRPWRPAGKEIFDASLIPDAFVEVNYDEERNRLEDLFGQ